jgi:N-acetylmuramoyl-L-alanine amidase
MKRIARLPWVVWVFCLLSGVFSLALVRTQFSTEQENKTRERATTYMLKDSSLLNQFAITGRGLEMYGTDTLNPDRVPEAVIYWDEVELFKKMLHTLPIDTVLRHYETKGTQRWDSGRFIGLPELTRPFVLNPSAEKPLAGLRVALDPGHVGGYMDYAQYMEEKYVRIRPDAAAGITEEIAFCEGNLALGTALLLAEKLRAAGATVMLTREKEGLNAFGLTFEEWLGRESGQHLPPLDYTRPELDSDPAVRAAVDAAAKNYVRRFEVTGKDSVWWMTKATLAHIHRLPFLKVEFLERARLIHDFKPHVTFIIHYNVGSNNNAAADGYRKGVPENYCMAFIPGSFMDGELKEPEDRLAFAAKLLSEDIPRSEKLSAHVVQAHERILKVPAVVWDDRLAYLKNASLLTPEKGVFSRNLQLTRLIHGTLCFGESLYQDNIQEAKALNARDFTLPGMTTPVPNRIRDVVDAYYEGLMTWLKAQ